MPGYRRWRGYSVDPQGPYRDNSPRFSPRLSRGILFMVACIGPLATINREPGQARKGAAAAVDSCAGVWLVRAATRLGTRKPLFPGVPGLVKRPPRWVTLSHLSH